MINYRIFNIKQIFTICLFAFGVSAFAQNKATDDIVDIQQKRWRDVVNHSPDAWFATPEAAAVAENVLLYQKEAGGWPKNIQMQKPLIEVEKTALRLTKHPRKSAEMACMDNGATTTEMRFLAKMYRHTGNERYKKAFCKALNFICTAQYSSGGWPQYYPLRGGYSDFITFNDDLHTNNLHLLYSILQGKGDFANLVDDALLAKAQTAYNKGVQCIIDCQVTENGVKTFWCAQHDPATLLPAEGRPHELPSYSGAEGSDLLQFLIDIENPSQEVKNTIESAVAFLQKMRIADKKVVPVMQNGVRVDYEIVDSAGDGIWARFIQLGGDVAKRSYSAFFKRLKGRKKSMEIDGKTYTFNLENNARDSYDTAHAHQPIYGIYDETHPYLLYRFLYSFEDKPDALDARTGLYLPTSLYSERRKNYNFLGAWGQKILTKTYPKWKEKN